MNGVKIRELLRFFCASHYNFGYFHYTPSLVFTQLAGVLNVCASAITHSLGQTLDLIADSVRPSVRQLVGDCYLPPRMMSPSRVTNRLMIFICHPTLGDTVGSLAQPGED